MPEDLGFYPYNRPLAPAAGLMSSLNDMTRFAIANINGGELDGVRVLAASAFDEMWAAHAPTPMAEFFGPQVSNYGLGWFVGEFMDHPLIGNYGALFGFQSHLGIFPEDDFAVVAMVNLFDPDAMGFYAYDIGNGVAELLLSDQPAAKIDRTTYAHPEALVGPDWLAEHLDDPAVRILDAREPLGGALHSYAHIPGASFVSVFADLCCPSEIMDADAFAQLMGELGVGNDTTVVVYDTDGGLWASRLWWALRYYGHEDVKMLNGGLLSWVRKGLPLETEEPVVAPAVFVPEVQPQWIATHDEVAAAIEDPDVFLVDALTRPNYVGDLSHYDRPGHIATALNLPAPDTLHPVLRTVLPPEELSRMLSRLGLDPEKHTITYCGGGIYGAHAAFVLYLMGFDQVGVYDGSLLQWTKDAANPMAVVP